MESSRPSSDPAPHSPPPPASPGPPSLCLHLQPHRKEPAGTRDVTVPTLASSAVPSPLHLTTACCSSPAAALTERHLSGSWRPRPSCGQGCSSWAPRAHLSPLPTSPGGAHSPAVGGLQTGPLASASTLTGLPCASLCLLSSLRTLVTGFRAHLTPDDLPETSFTSKTSAEPLIPIGSRAEVPGACLRVGNPPNSRHLEGFKDPGVEALRSMTAEPLGPGHGPGSLQSPRGFPQAARL